MYGPAMDWQPVHGVPRLRPTVTWIGSSSPVPLKGIKQVWKMDGFIRAHFCVSVRFRCNPCFGTITLLFHHVESKVLWIQLHCDGSKVSYFFKVNVFGIYICPILVLHPLKGSPKAFLTYYNEIIKKNCSEMALFYADWISFYHFLYLYKTCVCVRGGALYP